MFADIPQPHLVRRVRGELVADHAVLVHDGEHIVVRWRPSGTGLGALLVMTGADARDATQAVHAVLTHTDPVLVGQLVSEEPVAQRRIIRVRLVQHVDDVSVVPVALRHRLFEPLVIALSRQA